MRVLIFDDETHARERLRRLLRTEESVTIVGECASGAEALTAVNELAPDLLLLDIQMPELDGMALVRAIGPSQMPLVIFVTAFDEHAVNAFSVNAVDYLLKPVEAPRLREALDRARLRLGEVARQPWTATDRIFVRQNGTLYAVRTADIHWVEANRNYVRLHLRDRQYTVRQTMTELERRLGDGPFARIHKSTLVNLGAVREVQPWFGGDLLVILESGARLKVSRHYKHRLEHLTLG
jgi:two-component system LytT family response regulator